MVINSHGGPELTSSTLAQPPHIPFRFVSPAISKILRRGRAPDVQKCRALVDTRTSTRKRPARDRSWQPDDLLPMR